MAKRLIELNINGETYDVAVEPHRVLLDVLRDDLELTGTKEGCSTGDCGACTVIMDGKAVTACIVLAVDAIGSEITTIEGLAGPEGLDPLQEAFIQYGAVQCGYCTPGMVMAAKALLTDNPNPTEDEVKQELAGNLCRCTGYVKIIEAVMAAARGEVGQPVGS